MNRLRQEYSKAIQIQLQPECLPGSLAGQCHVVSFRPSIHWPICREISETPTSPDLQLLQALAVQCAARATLAALGKKLLVAGGTVVGTAIALKAANVPQLIFVAIVGIIACSYVATAAVNPGKRGGGCGAAGSGGHAAAAGSCGWGGGDGAGGGCDSVGGGCGGGGCGG